MKNFSKAPLSMTVGMMMSASLVAGVVHAESNPFAATELSPTAIQLAGVVPFESSTTPAAKSGAAPAEMSCGAMMHDKSDKQMGEMSCGAMMKNMPEGMSNEEKKAQCMRNMMDGKMQHAK